MRNGGAAARVAVIPGDGIGKEVTPEAVKVIRAAVMSARRQIEFVEFDWGADKYLRDGVSLPAGAVEMLRLVTDRGDAVVVNPPVYAPFYAFVSHDGRRVVEAGLFPVWEYDPAERTYHYFHPPVQRPVTDYLAMQGRFGHMLPEHIASIQTQANRNWQDMGFEVPAALREYEDPERLSRLRDTEYSMPLNRGVGA